MKTLEFRIFSTIIYSITILSLSLFVARLPGFAVSLAALITFGRITQTKYSKKLVQIIALLLIHFILVLSLQIMFVNVVEFFKSFALAVFAIFSFLGIKYAINSSSQTIASLSFLHRLVILFTISLAFIQIAEFILFKTTTSYFLFNDVSISTAADAGRFQASNFLMYYRPVSFFHEPSYFGTVCLMLLMGGRSLGLSLFWLILCALGILISFSSTVYFFSLLFLGSIFLRKGRAFLVFIIPVLLLFIVPYIDIILVVFRFEELFMPGTSGHERLIAPLQNIFNDMIEHFSFLGVALGQFSVQPNNSIFVLFGYYGLLAPVLMIGSYYWIKSWKLERRDMSNYIIFLGLILFVNGAIISPESQFMLFFLALTFRKAKETIKIENHQIIYST